MRNRSKELVLLTGAEGLIGRAILRLLKKRGFLVYPIVRKMKQVIDAVEIDLGKSKDIMCGFHGRNISTVIHCAALIPQNNSSTECIKAAQVNRRIDNNIIAFCSQNKCRLIYISTASVYDFTEGKIINEDSQVKPTNRYAIEKYISEKEIILNLQEQNPIIFRLNAPYGYGQKYETVLQKFVRNAISGKDLFYCGNGARIQDFIWAGDVAEAVYKSILHPNCTGIFNLAGGKPISMKKLAFLVVSTVKRSPSQVQANNEEDSQEKYAALVDLTKIQKEMDWHPKVSLENGIGRLAKYYRCKK